MLIPQPPFDFAHGPEPVEGREKHLAVVWNQRLRSFASLRMTASRMFLIKPPRSDPSARISFPRFPERGALYGGYVAPHRSPQSRQGIPLLQAARRSPGGRPKPFRPRVRHD